VPLAPGTYRKAHRIWELREDDDGNPVLVRLREETEVPPRRQASSEAAAEQAAAYADALWTSMPTRIRRVFEFADLAGLAPPAGTAEVLEARRTASREHRASIREAFVAGASRRVAELFEGTPREIADAAARVAFAQWADVGATPDYTPDLTPEDAQLLGHDAVDEAVLRHASLDAVHVSPGIAVVSSRPFRPALHPDADSDVPSGVEFSVARVQSEDGFPEYVLRIRGAKHELHVTASELAANFDIDETAGDPAVRSPKPPRATDPAPAPANDDNGDEGVEVDLSANDLFDLDDGDDWDADTRAFERRMPTVRRAGSRYVAVRVNGHAEDVTVGATIARAFAAARVGLGDAVEVALVTAKGADAARKAAASAEWLSAPSDLDIRLNCTAAVRRIAKAFATTPLVRVNRRTAAEHADGVRESLARLTAQVADRPGYAAHYAHALDVLARAYERRFKAAANYAKAKGKAKKAKAKKTKAKKPAKAEAQAERRRRAADEDDEVQIELLCGHITQADQHELGRVDTWDNARENAERAESIVERFGGRLVQRQTEDNSDIYLDSYIYVPRSALADVLKEFDAVDIDYDHVDHKRVPVRPRRAELRRVAGVIDDVAREFGVTKDDGVLQFFARHDPSGGRQSYLRWMMREHKRMAEVWTPLVGAEGTQDEIRETARSFWQNKQRLPADGRDIYKYDLREAYRVVRALGPTRKQRDEQNREGYEKIYEEGNAKIFRVYSEEASCALGKGAKWCISATEAQNYFDNYARNHDTYIAHVGAQKWAIHTHKGSRKIEILTHASNKEELHDEAVGRVLDYMALLEDEYPFSTSDAEALAAALTAAGFSWDKPEENTYYGLREDDNRDGDAIFFSSEEDRVEEFGEWELNSYPYQFGVTFIDLKIVGDLAAQEGTTKEKSPAMRVAAIRVSRLGLRDLRGVISVSKRQLTGNEDVVEEESDDDDDDDDEGTPRSAQALDGFDLFDAEDVEDRRALNKLRAQYGEPTSVPARESIKEAALAEIDDGVYLWRNNAFAVTAPKATTEDAAARVARLVMRNLIARRDLPASAESLRGLKLFVLYPGGGFTDADGTSYEDNVFDLPGRTTVAARRSERRTSASS
jgi:hypothetical protein